MKSLHDITKAEAKRRLEKLKYLIAKYRYSRLVLDKPLVEESVEDSLKKELFDLEQRYPDLISPDSPTQRVAGKALDKFEKFTHPAQMFSFNDAFIRQDMNDWIARLQRLDPEAVDGGYYCELKIDGLAIELVYDNGLMKVGATRGDGTVGENVTQNLKTVEAIPLKIQNPDDKIQIKELVVRGEVFITKKEFARINQEGNTTYANPRNLAAGSVRQLNSEITASRKLDSFAYALMTDLGQKVHEDEHKILRELGFKTNPHNKFCKNLDEVQQFRDHWEKKREKLDYEIDGIVVIVNDNKMFRKLGVVGKAPRAAIAYKFSPQESTTKLLNIIISIGRTGTLTPVAVLESVEIGGTTVSRATLHNEDEIKRLNVKIGDTVVVGRAGDVIPDIKRVIVELRTGKEKDFHFPKTCPVCGESVARSEGEAAHKCANKKCPAQKREAMYHFVSKSAVNIDGVGPKILNQLVDSGLIKNTADLYALTKKDFLNLERFADKSAENAVQAIQARKNIPLDRFIFALGIPHVGSETALDLAQRFSAEDGQSSGWGTLETMAHSSIDDFIKIKDIGNIVARSIVDWFQSRYNQKLLEKFKNVGVNVLKQESTQKLNKLRSMTFVFTGSLKTMTRGQAEEFVRERGGDASSSVSKETDYVVAGAGPGSKADRAKKLGVKIINEKKFLSFLK